MSTRHLGYELTCDGCGVVAEQREDQAVATRRAAHAKGWVTTSYRRADGRWNSYKLDGFASGVGPALDACPDCAPTWTPPYSLSAARELSREVVAGAIAEGSIGALMRRVEEMGAELVQLRDRLHATGGGTDGR